MHGLGSDPFLGLEQPQMRASSVSRCLLIAGLVFVICEAVYGLSWRWYHQPLYYALIAGLTLAGSLLLGAVLTLVHVSVPKALVLWAAAIAGVSNALGPDHALRTEEIVSFASSVLVAGWMCSRTAGITQATPGLLGSCAGGGLVVGLLRGAGLASLLRLDGLPFAAGEALCVALIFAAFFGGLPGLQKRYELRVAPVWGTLAALLLTVGHSALPLLEAPDGKHRLPPANYTDGSMVSGKHHVFLLVLDTVRADHLSIYGSERNTTPELDRWVQERDNVVVYPQAYANGAWTVPSHATLFTGLLPNAHGVHFDRDGSGSRYRFGLRDETQTLAEALGESGYARLGSFSNNWLRTIIGMHRGFDRYLLAPNFEPLPFAGEKLRQWLVPGLAPEAAKGGARASDVNRALLSMIEPWAAGSKPLFVFGNYGDAHGPYAPPPGFRGTFAPAGVRERTEHLSLEHSTEELQVLEARYDEEILYLDSELGRFFDEIQRLGIFDDSWVIVTSDHGEAFKEHGLLEHGTTVHNEVTRIPLVIFPPKGIHIPQDGGAVSLADVAKTIAAIGGAKLDGPGRDLRVKRSGQPVVAIEFYGDAGKAKRHGDMARYPSQAVLWEGYKLIKWGHDYYLHDIIKDPHERFNLYTHLEALAATMQEMLPKPMDPNAVEGMDPGEDALKVLRGFGYLPSD